MNDRFIKSEDYLEPDCPLCGDPFGRQPKQITLGRVIEKLDGYIADRDTDGALRHIAYWQEEARSGRDEAGFLTLQNEKMGILRNAGRTKEAGAAADEALALAER